MVVKAITPRFSLTQVFTFLWIYLPKIAVNFAERSRNINSGANLHGWLALKLLNTTFQNAMIHQRGVNNETKARYTSSD